MKVRTKIALLLLAVVSMFVIGLVALKLYDRENFRELSAAREEARPRSFDEFLRHWTQPLETFATYFGTWDGMVNAIANPNPDWIEANLHEHTLASYRSCSVWAYDAAGQPAFHKDLLYSDALTKVPVPENAIPAVFEGKSVCHFFAETPLGLMEIRGTTVHPSLDSAKETPPRGYFFAGRLWTTQDIREMALFTGNDVRLIRAGEPLPQEEDDISVVSFQRVLPGWDGVPVAALAIRQESPILEQLNRSSERLFWVVLAFGLLLALTLFVSLTRWVSRPLKALCLSLKDGHATRIQPLQEDRGEFGDFARMMAAFFEQRQNLFREMAERKQTQEALHESEERLRHSQKMEAVGRLAGGIAHDFNNLLTAIIGYSELIALSAHDRAVQEEAEMIRKAGEKAAGLTRQLLAFSRKQILQPRVIDLNALVLEMKKLLQRVIGEHIELQVFAEAENSRVNADPTQLEQVIVNLGVNARDAMPRGGVLTMRTSIVTLPAGHDGQSESSARREFVALTVADTGCGMDAETKERIFEPFFTTKGPGKGTGLGLATVYGIVQQSGGHLEVQSEPGNGTVFTILLPQEKAPVDVQRTPPPLLRESRPGETVLVVEDERIVRDLVCAVLSHQGYDVICAAHGSDGLRKAREHERAVDLLITDVVMPQMSGVEVADALLEEQPGARVLFISGYSDNELGEHGVLDPDVEFLEKPFTPEALSRKVRSVLDEVQVIGR